MPRLPTEPTPIPYKVVGRVVEPVHHSSAPLSSSLRHFVERVPRASPPPSAGAMGMAFRLTRRSINAFFDGYHSFTSIAALLVFPASAAILLSQAMVPFSAPVLEAVSLRLSLLFRAARFPEFFSIVNVKLAQTAFTFAATLPLVLTFLLLGKASVVRVVCEGIRRNAGPPPAASFLPLYRRILPTHLFNSLLILSANATVFAFLFLAFNAADVLGISSGASRILLSAAGAVIYSVIVANATVICNLALVAAAMGDCSGLLAVLRACQLVRGRVMTALAMALPANLGLAAVEALFQYRVVRQYGIKGEITSSLLWEAFSIAYFHALLLVLEVIMNCMFYKTCTSNWEHQGELEPEEKNALPV